MVLAIFCLHLGGFGNTVIYAWQSRELRRKSKDNQESRERLSEGQTCTSADASSRVCFGGATVEIVEATPWIDDSEADAMYWFASHVEAQVGEMARREREGSGRLAMPSS